MTRKRILLHAALWWVLLLARASMVQALAPEEIRQDLFEPCFLNQREGWIVGERGRIFHTADGGASFERLFIDTRRAFLSIECFPDRRLVVVGQAGIIYRSEDGGQTWSKVESGTDRNLLSVDFADARVGVAVGDFGTILRTTDGGQSWVRVPVPEELPLPEDIAEIIMPGDVLLYDVHFPTPQRGWIVGEFGVMLTTADGGATWEARKGPVESTLFGVHFADEQRGWAVGLEAVMLHTTDGGNTWSSRTIRSRSGFVLSLYDIAVQGSFGWAVGDSGFVLRSTDGGETWQQVALPIELAANWLRGVSLAPDSTGAIVGAEGLILAVDRNELRRLGR